MNINSVSNIGGIGINNIRSKSESGNLFEEVLKNTLDNANETDRVNESDMKKLLSGDVDDLHTSMIEMEKADLALQFTIQIRNKMMDAYNEIMRMQI